MSIDTYKHEPTLYSIFCCNLVLVEQVSHFIQPIAGGVTARNYNQIWSAESLYATFTLAPSFFPFKSQKIDLVSLSFLCLTISNAPSSRFTAIFGIPISNTILIRWALYSIYIQKRTFLTDGLSAIEHSAVRYNA